MSILCSVHDNHVDWTAQIETRCWNAVKLFHKRIDHICYSVITKTYLADVVCHGDLTVHTRPTNTRVYVFQLYNDTFHIWTRPITPTGSYAVAAVYSKQQGYPIRVSMPLSAINLNAPQGYNITEVFDDIAVGYLKPNQNLTYTVNPSGIYLLRATVMN